MRREVTDQRLTGWLLLALLALYAWRWPYPAPDAHPLSTPLPYLALLAIVWQNCRAGMRLIPRDANEPPHGGCGEIAARGEARRLGDCCALGCTAMLAGAVAAWPSSTPWPPIVTVAVVLLAREIVLVATARAAARPAT